MQTTYDITGEIEWIGDLTEDQVSDIHECMKKYAREIIDECADKANITHQGGINKAGDWEEDVYVDKWSIWKVKQQIK